MSAFSLPNLNDGQDRSGRPKYERLKDHLLREMHSGHLRPGDALPSEQRLAATLNVARSTVRQAMSVLERDGVVLRVHGKGTFIHEQAFQRLKGGQSLFALIVPETQFGFYPWLLRSFEDSARELHHQVIVCNSHNEVDKQGNAILQLIDREVAGVAIVPTTATATPAFQLRQLQKRGVPVVFCSRRVEEVRAPLISIPFREVGRRAGEMMIAAGHRRIAYLGVHRSRASLEYEAGVRAAIQAYRGPDLIQLHAFYGQSSIPDITAHEQEIAEAVEQMCQRNDRPTAIFASFDSLAELLFVLLTQRGFRVPEDISIVGFGGSRREGALQRRLTSVTVDEVQMGHIAIELLEQMGRSIIPIESDETRELTLGINQGETLAELPLARRRNGTGELTITGGKPD